MLQPRTGKYFFYFFTDGWWRSCNIRTLPHIIDAGYANSLISEHALFQAPLQVSGDITCFPGGNDWTGPPDNGMFLLDRVNNDGFPYLTESIYNEGRPYNASFGYDTYDPVAGGPSAYNLNASSLRAAPAQNNNAYATNIANSYRNNLSIDGFLGQGVVGPANARTQNATGFGNNSVAGFFNTGVAGPAYAHPQNATGYGNNSVAGFFNTGVAGPAYPIVQNPSETQSVAAAHNAPGYLPFADPATDNKPRFPCSHPGCSKTFSRSADMARHFKKHDPVAPLFYCTEAGCKFSGEKGFYRRDKLLSHVRTVHAHGE